MNILQKLYHYLRPWRGYVVTYSDGPHDTFADYEQARRAVAQRALELGIGYWPIGHAGDLTDGGDRTLCWADRAHVGDESRAVATIRVMRG